MEEEFKKKNNHTTIVALIVLIIVLLMAAGYYFYKRESVLNPVKITTELIGDMANESKITAISNNFFAEKNSTQMEVAGKIGDYKLNIKSEFDLKNSKVALLANLNEKNINLFNVLGAINNDSLLFKVAENGNVYKLANDFSELFKGIHEYSNLLNNTSDKYIDYFITSFEESVNPDDFIKTKEQLTIFGSELKITKFEKVFSEQDIKNILNSYIDKIEKDEDIAKIYNDMAKLMGESESLTYQESLRKFKSELHNGLFEDVSFKYSMYINGSDVVRIQITTVNSNERIIFDVFDDKFGFEISGNNFNYGFDYDKKTNGYSIKLNNVVIASGIITIKPIDNSYINGMLFEFKIDIPLLQLSGEINGKIAVNSDIKVPDISQYNALDITDEDNYEIFMEELENNEFINQLINNMYGDAYGGWDSIDGIEPTDGIKQ